MVFLKAVTVAVAGVVTLLAARRILRNLEAARVRVKKDEPQQRMTRLRQDPKTGVYFPEN
jgi:hypothetical protein